MACPYFYPVKSRTSPGETQHAMLPLGDLWAGECHAEPLQPCHAPDQGLRMLCNLGYARGSCARFPGAPGVPDAVRFTVASDDGPVIRLLFAIERNHHPFLHGPLEYSTTCAAFAPEPADENLSRQAHAYVDSYLRRKHEAATA